MSGYDVVCIGPLFLDITFAGLERAPVSGEEVFARDLQFSPGGAAITAVGAARLGLRSAILWPTSHDVAGEYLRAQLRAEGVDWIGHESTRTPVTVVLPMDGDRAMATFEPDDEPAQAEVGQLETRALVMSIGRAGAATAPARQYAVCGYRESTLARHGALRLTGCRALLVNEDEALRLTGASDPESAAVQFARSGVSAVVITLGARGALEWSDGTVVRVAAPEVEVRDTTGAGDLFTSAYVFADLAGAAREERLAFASLYAGLSVRTATGVRGALTLREFELEARLRGLPSFNRPAPREETP